MRLIDADALMCMLEPIIEAETQIYRRESWGFAVKCRNEVEEAPTVDIVTCGECKYCERESVYEQTPYGFENEVTDKYVYCTKHHDEDGELLDVRLDDFCSWAERREDGGR